MGVNREVGSLFLPVILMECLCGNISGMGGTGFPNLFDLRWGTATVFVSGLICVVGKSLVMRHF